MSIRQRRYRRRLISDINVTPFVDIILVLLIVFMISAPLLTSGVVIDLPDAKMQPVAAKETPITISVNAKGEIFYDDQALQSLSELTERVRATAQVSGGRERQVFIRADYSLEYQMVVSVLEVLTTTGFTSISLLTEPRR